MAIKTGNSADVNVTSTAVMGKDCHKETVFWKLRYGITIAVPHSAGRLPEAGIGFDSAVSEVPTAGSLPGQQPCPYIKISEKKGGFGRKRSNKVTRHKKHSADTVRIHF